MASASNLDEFVDLDRLYRRTDVEIDVWRHASRDQRRQDWAWLVQHPVVALLAEAGSGKTRELRHQQARSDGPCFLLRVEALCQGTLDGALDTPQQAAALSDWLRSDGKALFLLDAVDEAKLPRSRTAAPLRDALSTLRRGIGDRLGDIHLVVTCRSSEWHHDTEQAPLLALAAAMAAARGDLDGPSAAADHADDPTVGEGLLAVTFAPLSSTAIDRLGRSHGVGDGFVEALRETGALDHAVTPLDVIHYADLHVAERERGGSGLPRTRKSAHRGLRGTQAGRTGRQPVNRRGILTPDRRPTLTPLQGMIGQA